MYGFIIKYVPYVRLILTLGVTQPPRDVLLELESQFLIGDAMGEAALPRLLETYSKTAPSPDTWMGGWEVEECPCVAIFIPSFFLAATVWCTDTKRKSCYFAPLFSRLAEVTSPSPPYLQRSFCWPRPT